MNTGTQNIISTIASTCALRGAWQVLCARPGKGFDFLGDRISENELTVATRLWDRMSVKLHRLYEQGADQARPVQTLQHWIRWAKTGVSLKVKALILKTTEILQNTCSVQAPLKSN